MSNDTDRSVRVVSRREALQGAGLALGSLVASGTLTETVLAQSGGPSDEISGIVEDGSGPVSDATVVAVPHDTSLDALETTTDANGEYIFERSDLHEDRNLYHVIARGGTETDPRRGVPNYPFIAADGSVPIPDSGVSRYEFEQDGSDSWGSNPLTINGATFTTDAAVGSYAIATDGTDDYAQGNGVTEPFSVGEMSVSAWVKVPTLSQTDSYAIQTTGVGGTPGEMSLIYGFTADTFEFFAGDGFRFSVDSISDNQYHHIVGTYRESDGQFDAYLDGTSVNSGTDASGFGDQTYDSVFVGRANAGLYFESTFDDVRLYRKRLTSTEVSNLYNTGSIDG